MELRNLLKFPMTENRADGNFTSRVMQLLSAEMQRARWNFTQHTLPACILRITFSITLNTGLILCGNVLKEDMSVS